MHRLEQATPRLTAGCHNLSWRWSAVLRRSLHQGGKRGLMRKMLRLRVAALLPRLSERERERVCVSAFSCHSDLSSCLVVCFWNTSMCAVCVCVCVINIYIYIYIYVCVYMYTYKEMGNGWMDAWMDGGMDGWLDEWMDG